MTTPGSTVPPAPSSPGVRTRDRYAVSAPWSQRSAGVLAALDSGPAGLSAQEAAGRLSVVGANELEGRAGRHPAAVFLDQFRSPLIYILLVAAAVTVALDELLDAAAIALVLGFNAVVGFFQEYRAERSMEALREMAAPRARVRRDGVATIVESRAVVPGDLLELEAGAWIPADARLIEAATVAVDESTVTGESTPVAKSTEPVGEAGGRMPPLAERHSMVWTGTTVVRGRALAVVTATGRETELGRIAGSVQEAAAVDLDTPLQRRVAGLARMIGAAVLALGVLGFAVGMVAGEDPADLFLTLVALAVSAVPEGLPIVLTVTLAVGLRRMAARRVIIRRLPAVETLGSCTLVGSDKTGTLTENRMTVRRIWAGGRMYEVHGAALGEQGSVMHGETAVRFPSAVPPPWETAGAPEHALHAGLLTGLLCNDAQVSVQAPMQSPVAEAGADSPEAGEAGDPTEVALLVSAHRAGLDADELRARFPRIAEIPFASERRFGATLHRLPDGEAFLAVKGAQEVIAAMCVRAAGPAAPADWRDAAEREAEAMALGGMRVLAMAGRVLTAAEARAFDEEATPGELEFYGLQGMIDPPRPEAVAAVRGCQQAGLRVVMVTGDHGATALAIARQLGIAESDATLDEVVTGRQLTEMSDERLRQVVDRVAVYARVSPEQKLRIVRAAQHNGEIVAMTGDGVNDAPALRAADIGVAMGRGGTDVAREAADMVITDDNFASIFAAVEEGRVIHDNVRHATLYLLACNLGEVFTVLLALFIGFDLPLLPVQLLWLNVVTDAAPAMALAFEPGERSIVQRPPRPPDEPLITRLLWERVALAAVVLTAGTLWLFQSAVDSGEGLDRARTVALTTIVLFQVLHVGNARSDTDSAFRRSPLSNRAILLGSGGALLLHLLAMLTPPGQALLRVEPLDAAAWMQMVVVSVSIVIAVDLHKRLRPLDTHHTAPR